MSGDSSDSYASSYPSTELGGAGEKVSWNLPSSSYVYSSLSADQRENENNNNNSNDHNNKRHSEHQSHRSSNVFTAIGYELVEKLVEIRDVLRRDQLPWLDDFFDRKQFVLPKSKEEAIERLNLNLPYYGANYIVVFYTITLPFLMVYDPLFFLLVSLSAILLHTIHLRERRRSYFGANITIAGISIQYKRLVDFHIIILLTLFFFRDGLRTVGIVLLINSLIILPHAVWRKPTYFDDEELEKLRPKMMQYIISLVLLILVYLECKGAPVGIDKRSHQK
ncbi:Prenylated rab acceptor PRA1 [Trypanosoma melophagium]|uniref:Prenylated rab acceptor PRA1 n=1 Tax=Trypanosoma melophagium TaxID=715481 RepID=UPI00351A4993|nr:Prenylated rab acceptor PRA1 [Trypanosoma melophagium]